MLAHIEPVEILEELREKRIQLENRLNQLKSDKYKGEVRCNVFVNNKQCANLARKMVSYYGDNKRYSHDESPNIVFIASCETHYKKLRKIERKVKGLDD